MNREFTFDPEHAAELLGILSNASRLQIIQLISQREWDVTSLASRTSLSQSALSQHLKKMRDIRIVQTRRHAQTIYYSCTNKDVEMILATLDKMFNPAVDQAA